jgi:hypothetical protein
VSCSEFAKQRIRSEGLLSAILALPGRFNQCHEAYATVIKPNAVSGAELCGGCLFASCCHNWEEEKK